MNRLVIGLEATGLLNPNPSGIGIYIKNLIINLKNINKNVVIFYKITRIKHLKILKVYSDDNLRWHYKNIYNPFHKKVNIVHLTDNTFLNYSGVPKIFTIHDLAVFKSVTQIKYYTSEKHKQKIKHNLSDILKNVDAIIAVSNTTKNDLIEFYNFPQEKIRVISLAPNKLTNFNDLTVVNTNLNFKKKGYFLYVGNISVRKNIINLLKAYALNYLSEDYQLVLAGSMGMGVELIKKTIFDLKLGSRVKLLNYVPSNVLSSLYKNSAGLLFPTYYEGFGIPILEAMQHRIPFLIGNIGAAPETAGGHGIKVSPFSVEEISDGIKLLLDTTDLQIEEAHNYVKNFSWEKNASETNKFYQDILDNF